LAAASKFGKTISIDYRPNLFESSRRFVLDISFVRQAAAASNDDHNDDHQE
jgi:hypothetical protein